MKKISEKSITDLEFDIVLEQAASRCATELGKSSLLTLRPHTSFRVFKLKLNESTSTTVLSAVNTISPIMALSLSTRPWACSLLKTARLRSSSFNTSRIWQKLRKLLRFFKKQTLFPQLHKFGEDIPIEKSIPKKSIG